MKREVSQILLTVESVQAVNKVVSDNICCCRMQTIVTHSSDAFNVQATVAPWPRTVYVGPMAAPAILIWGLYARGSEAWGLPMGSRTEAPVRGLRTKSHGSWSSLQRLFTDFDCRNDQNLKISMRKFTTFDRFCTPQFSPVCFMVKAKRHLQGGERCYEIIFVIAPMSQTISPISISDFAVSLR